MKDNGDMAKKVINLVIDLTTDEQTHRPSYRSASHLKIPWIYVWQHMFKSFKTFKFESICDKVQGDC